MLEFVWPISLASPKGFLETRINETVHCTLLYLSPQLIDHSIVCFTKGLQLLPNNLIGLTCFARPILVALMKALFYLN